MGFLLDVFSRQQRGRTLVYAVGRLQNGDTFGIVETRHRPAFHIRSSDVGRASALMSAALHAAPVPWTTMDGTPVAEISAESQRALRGLAEDLRKHGIVTYGADVRPSQRFYTDLGLRGAVSVTGPWRRGRNVSRVYTDPELKPVEFEPDLTVLTLDIETTPTADQVLAVSLVVDGPNPEQCTEEVLVVGDPAADDPHYLTCCHSEAELLTRFRERLTAIDPDVLTGWNVLDFDLPTLQRRFAARNVRFELGRAHEESWYRKGESWGHSRMVIRGRQTLDAMHLVRHTLTRFEDYRLDTVAKAILGRGKTLDHDDDQNMAEVILGAYHNNRREFCEYCLEDARLVRDILDAEGLLKLTLRRSLMTGLTLERAWGSVAAFELLYISELHRRHVVAPDLGQGQGTAGAAPGGLVLEAKPGLYRNVLVFDFKSLYPSIIRTFNIDPLAYARARDAQAQTASGTTRLVWNAETPAHDAFIIAPNGAAFDRAPGVLPALLDDLFAHRQEAKAQKHELASFTYKILMNSFYGVLATPACRFADSRLAGAITEFGHYVLRWTRDTLERRGCRVLYGDTDSLFVDPELPPEVSVTAATTHGNELCAELNEALAQHVHARFGVASQLELEFEKYYRRFFLPRIRGNSGRGRAKGYAGLQVSAAEERLDIVGMEAVRSDWTELAHDVQRKLLTLLFHDRPTEEIEAYIAATVADMKAGKCDALLVYRKRLRKGVAGYTRTTPPHVKAAKQMDAPSGMIRYLVTTQGPQPAAHPSAPLDYGHYIQKQVYPIVHSIAQVCGLDARAAVNGELTLFRDSPT